MAKKASKKSTLDALQDTLAHNVVVDFARSAINRGVSAAQLGSELMAQGYAMVSSIDLADARKEVTRMIRGKKKPAKRKTATRKTGAKAGVKKPTARKTTAKRGTTRAAAGRKPAARKPAARKPAVRKTTARKAAAARKPAMRRTSTRKGARK